MANDFLGEGAVRCEQCQTKIASVTAETPLRPGLPRVLVVDDALKVCGIPSAGLDLDAVLATSSGAAIALRNDPAISVVLVAPGGDPRKCLALLDQLRQLSPDASFVAIARASSVTQALAALGVPWPTPPTERPSPRLHQPSVHVQPRMPAARRWAYLAAGVLSLHEDPRTVADWAKGIGVSQGAIRTLCRTVGVSPKQSLKLARVLRAVLLSREAKVELRHMFDAIDLRTVRRLIAVAGISEGGVVPSSWSFDELLTRQQFVLSPILLGELRLVLAEARR